MSSYSSLNDSKSHNPTLSDSLSSEQSHKLKASTENDCFNNLNLEHTNLYSKPLDNNIQLVSSLSSIVLPDVDILENNANEYTNIQDFNPSFKSFSDLKNQWSKLLQELYNDFFQSRLILAGNQISLGQQNQLIQNEMDNMKKDLNELFCKIIKEFFSGINIINIMLNYIDKYHYTIYIMGGGSNVSLERFEVFSHLNFGPFLDLPTLPTSLFYCSAISINHCIYLIGGAIDQNIITDKVYILDLFKNTSWQLLTHIPSPRFLHCSIVINDKIYIIGGRNNQMEIIDLVECYDTSSNIWSSLPHLIYSRCAFSCISLNDNIIVIGGVHKKIYLDSLEEFDFIHNSWKILTHLPIPRMSSASVSFNNKIYVLGGFFNEKSLKNVDCFDYNLKKWESLRSMQYERAGISAILLPLSHNIYIFGGWDNQYKVLDSIDCYDINNDEWSFKSTLNIPRRGPAVVTIHS